MQGLMLIIIFEVITLLPPKKLDSKGLLIVKAMLDKTLQERQEDRALAAGYYLTS